MGRLGSGPRVRAGVSPGGGIFGRGLSWGELTPGSYLLESRTAHAHGRSVILQCSVTARDVARPEHERLNLPETQFKPLI